MNLKPSFVFAALALVTGCAVAPSESTSESSSAIYGGATSTRASVVGFVEDYGDKEWQISCSGTIVRQPKASKAYVVTAAHCHIGTGTYALYRDGSGDHYLLVNKVTEHPDFVEFNANSDIAVIEVDVPYTMQSSPLKTLDLPSSKDGLAVGTAVTLAGWGESTYYDGPSDFDFNGRKKVDKDVIVLGSKSMNWSNGTTSGVCYGDSGGAVVLNETLVGVIHGSLSIDAHCGGVGELGTATRVKDKLTWIEAQIP